MKVWISALVSLCYYYYIVSKIPKGMMRLVLQPFFSHGWVTNSKLLLYAFDQSPLSSDHPKPFLHFLAIACLPIKIKPNPSSKSASNPSVLLFSLMLRIYDYRPHLHQNFIMILYCGHVYLLLEIVPTVCSAPARALLGLEIEPQSNEPYFSTSLQEAVNCREIARQLYEPEKYSNHPKILNQVEEQDQPEKPSPDRTSPNSHR
ncbi:hypothetical protein NE237_011117 [Protea cynaroides]|uniref:Uncharacterized protein n=1 Tax=Protea cynaroides TaxID=273540 RepID=A0A9Q0JVJ6_9MAGN|nr:hypothetical protein NE237_011117 [Protea cynaroides]